MHVDGAIGDRWSRSYSQPLRGMTMACNFQSGSCLSLQSWSCPNVSLLSTFNCQDLETLGLWLVLCFAMQAVEYRPLLTTLFSRYVDPCLEYCRRNFRTVVPLPAVNQVRGA